MKTLKLTFALLVLTLMSCSTDDGFPIVENGQGGGNGDGIIASWVYVRYELYDIGETEPYEVVDIPCGFIYTVTPKEEEGRFRAEITNCSGGFDGARAWVRVGEEYSRTYTDENNTDLEIKIDGYDMTQEVLGSWEIGNPKLIAFYRDVEGL